MTTVIWHNLVKPRLEKARRLPAGQGIAEAYRACCPAHDDRNPSLSAALLDDGRILLKCHAHQCRFEEIIAALGISPRDAGPDHYTHCSPPAFRDGPAAWASAAKAAEAARDAMIDALAFGTAEKILQALDSIEDFRAAARLAMRRGGAR